MRFIRISGFRSIGKVVNGLAFSLISFTLLFGSSPLAAQPRATGAPSGAQGTPAHWTATGSLGLARYGHTATLLPDGSVLVAGGAFEGLGSLESVEVFDPTTGAWTQTDPLATPRAGHTATLLTNGEVLVVGGTDNSSTTLSSAEVYDPT